MTTKIAVKQRTMHQIVCALTGWRDHGFLCYHAEVESLLQTISSHVPLSPAFEAALRARIKTQAFEKGDLIHEETR